MVEAVVAVLELLRRGLDEEVVEVTISEDIDVDDVVKLDIWIDVVLVVLLEVTTVVELVAVVNVVLVDVAPGDDTREIVMELLVVALSSIAEGVVASGVVDSTMLVVVGVDTTDGDELVMVAEVVEALMVEEVVLGRAVDVELLLAIMELLGPFGLGGMKSLLVETNVVELDMGAGELMEEVELGLLIGKLDLVDVGTTLTELVDGLAYAAAGDQELLANTDDELDGCASG